MGLTCVLKSTARLWQIFAFTACCSAVLAHHLTLLYLGTFW